jgi:hypothetical protein
LYLKEVMNNLNKILRLSLAGVVIVGSSDAFGMENLSQLWSRTFEKISQVASPREMRFLSVVPLLGTMASYFTGHISTAAFFGLSTLSMHSVAYIQNRYIKDLQLQLLHALADKKPLKPIVRKFDKKLAYHVMSDAISSIVVQRSNQLKIELQEKLKTMSPRTAWKLYFEGDNALAQDLHNILLYNNADPYYGNSFYQKVLDILQVKSMQLQNDALKQLHTNFQENASPLYAIQTCLDKLYEANIDIPKAISFIGVDGLRRLVQEYPTKQSSAMRDCLALLISHDINPYTRDDTGKNAFDYAQGDQILLALLSKTRHLDAPFTDYEKAPTIMEAFLAYHLHLDLHSQSKEIFTWLSKPENLPLFSMIKRERQFTQAATNTIDQASHYVFYHAHAGMHRIIQDINRHILQFEQQDDVRDFIPVRFWHHCQKSSNILDFIVSTGLDGNSPTLINDNVPKIQQNLLAVNLSFLGNAQRSGESTMFYYRENRSIAQYDTRELIIKTCEYYDFNAVHLVKILNQNMSDACGSVLQIFIPRQYVNHIVYLAQPWGIPYKTNLGFDGFQTVGAIQCHTKITPIIDSIRSETFTRKVSPYIMDRLQARIVLGQDIMLNYKSGIKIFRIDHMSNKERQRYKKIIDDGCRLMFINWLERILQRNPDGTCGVKQEALNRIKDTPLGKLVQNHDQVRALLQKLRAEARASASKDRQSKL